MSRSLGTLSLDIVAKIGGLIQGLSAADRELDKRAKKWEADAKKLGAAVGVAAVAAATALSYMVRQTINNMDELTKLAQSAGVAVEELSALTYAADLSGVSQDQLGTAFVRLSKNMSDAAQGIGEARKGFDTLGISVKNADGTLKSSSAVLSEVAGKFQQYQDGAEKTALAVNLFGKAGAGLIPLLNQGADGIAEMTAEARELGLVFDEDTGRAAELFNDNLTRLNAVKKGLVTRIAAELLPSLASLTSRLFESAKSSERLDKAARIAATGVKIMASAGAIVAGIFVAVGEALGGIAATVVEFFSGNFARAFSIAKEATSDFVGNIRGTANTVASIWDDTAVDIESGADANAEKIAAPVIKAEDKVKRAGKKIVDEAAKIYQRVEEQIARIQRDIDTFFFTDEQVILFDLRVQGADPEQLQRAERLLQIRKDLNKEEEDRQKMIRQEERQQGVLDQLNMEIEALGKSAEWIAKRNALLDAGVTAESDFGKAIVSTVEELYRQGEAMERQIELMDTFRSAASNALTDVISVSKSAKDAMLDFLDAINRRVLQMITEGWIEQLFGQMGTNQTGSQGNWISAIFGAFSGAKGNASGGNIPGRSLRRVNEFGMEMATVGGEDYLLTGAQGANITPAHRVGGGGGGVVNNFAFAAPTSPKTQTQIAARVGYEVRRSQRLGT